MKLNDFFIPKCFSPNNYEKATENMNEFANFVKLKVQIIFITLKILKVDFIIIIESSLKLVIVNLHKLCRFQ